MLLHQLQFVAVDPLVSLARDSGGEISWMPNAPCAVSPLNLGSQNIPCLTCVTCTDVTADPSVAVNHIRFLYVTHVIVMVVSVSPIDNWHNPCVLTVIKLWCITNLVPSGPSPSLQAYLSAQMKCRGVFKGHRWHVLMWREFFADMYVCWVRNHFPALSAQIFLNEQALFWGGVQIANTLHAVKIVKLVALFEHWTRMSLLHHHGPTARSQVLESMYCFPLLICVHKTTVVNSSRISGLPLL